MATASMLTPFYSLGRESNYSLHVNPLLRTRTQIHYQLIIKNKHFLIKRPENNNFRGVIEVIRKTLNLVIQKTAIATVILGLLMTYDPYSALAASGGRMGGRAFSSSSSESTSSSTSPSYSSGSSSWGSSSSSSDSSPRYSSSESSSSSASSSPSYSRGSSSSSSSHYSSWGSSSFSSSPSYRSSSSSSPSYWRPSLQKDLDKIAEVSDTSTRSGLSYILRVYLMHVLSFSFGCRITLLRHLAYCFSSYSSVDVKPDKVDGENLFNKLTIEERAKFDEETLVNVDNIKKQSTPNKNPNGLSSDYLVMTILVAAMGDFKLGVVNNSDDLKKALQKLGSISTSKILAVEVMWTPQEENDTLTESEMLEDYPRLKPL
ncbi:hypothetical protein MKW98_025138 [Papaver atlanticum]|uniref:Uncharacterized protein n=1 Tax=Papaver atlanticum TaxID=357466 RepID=A0AAD4S204_9MAGN|nr:hypothetical protein MKW98_025138 [Papaver atlanticum]